MMHKKRLLLLFLFSLVSIQGYFSQCLQVLDGNGAFSDMPQYVSCTPGNFTVFIQPDRDMGNYTINWGDGSANSTGAGLLTTQNEMHTYAGATANYTITITDNSTGCTIMGTVVLERNPLASIQLPAGDDNFGCTPVQFRFINSSTQISSNTTFTWDFGDGSPTETYDFTNLGDTVLHTYLPGVGVQSCELNVTLTATNFCGSSTASFFPLRVWDLDEAQITPSAALLCYPDTIVQYTNSTIRNCFPEGNQSQRYERWNFGDYWGLGRDSIIEWRPWNPPIIAPPPIGYPGVGTYFVTLQDSSFCGIDDVTISIQITDPPVAVLTSTKDTICEGESVTFINSSTGGANRFRWNYDLGAGFQGGSGGNKTRTYNNSGDYTIRLAVRINGAQGCNDTASVDLHVLPSPTADFTFDNNDLCDSMDVTFTNTSSGAIATYNWNFGNGNTFIGPSPPVQSYNIPMTYSATLTVANMRGCSDTESKQLRVRETPVANFTVNSVCLNTAATFTDLSTSGGDPITSYNWAFGDGATSTQQNPTHLYTAFGTYTVRQIVSNGFCNDTAEIMVTVENRPTASFVSTPDEGCSRLTVNFTNQSSANATTFRWNFGDGSSPVFARDTSHTYTNSGDFDTTFVVQMIAFTAFGCSDTTLDTISVFPIPTPSFTSDAVVDCGPVTVNFTNTTVGDSLDFFWNFGDGSTIVNDTNPTHIFENKTLFINNYEVRLIVASQNGCRDTTSQIIQIYPEPIFTFSTVPDSGCSPLSVTFPSVVGAVDYQWDFGDGTTGSGPTPTHLYVNNTTNNQNYTIRLIARNSFGCTDTTFGSVLVFPNPSSAFVIDTNVGCQPLPIEITNNSTGSNTFFWDFGDGTNSTNTNSTFIKTFTNTSAVAQFNDIRLIVETTSGCRDTSTRTVEVHPFIQAAFTSDTIGCSPLPVSFVNQSFGAQSYQWSFGDNTTDNTINPSHTYTNSGNSNQLFLAKMIAISTEGCLDSAEKNITVYPKPTASYTLSTNQGCQPLEVTFTNASSLADSCVWNYGDLDSFKLCTPTNVHTYTNTTSFFPIDYTSELFVFTNDGCSDTFDLDITVNPEVIADFTSIDSGCSPLNVSFQNQSLGANSYAWTYGDGASDTLLNPTHLYENMTFSDEVNNLRMIATSQYGCSDTTEKDITVFAKPDAQFTTDLNSGCHPLPVTFTNASVIADSCRWNFGDGSPINDTCFTSRVFTYQNNFSSLPITRKAELFVFTDNGCRDTFEIDININPEVIANFSSLDSGCSPLQVAFQNQSIGANDYAWTFGDGASDTLVSPVHVYRNTTFVDQVNNMTLIASSQYGCSDTIEKVITVFAKPDAQFTTDVTSGCHPVEVNFTNSSSIADSCRWNFGDGSPVLDTCFLNIPRLHVYENTVSSLPLIRTAELFVYTNNGCSDTINRDITVNPYVQAAFTSPTEGCSPLSVNFTNQSIGATGFQWSYGDGGSDTQREPSHLFLNLGQRDTLFTTRLVATNDFGCSSDSEIVITIFPKPTADFSIDVNDGCQPLIVQFTNNSNLADICDWTYGDGTSNLNDCTPITSHTYTNTQSLVPITNTAALTVTTLNGCTDMFSRDISVRPQVTAAFTTDADSCAPVDATFRSQSFGAFEFEWDFDDGAMGTGQVIAHRFTNIGAVDSIYRVRLIAKSAFSCNDTAYEDVTVHPTPIVDFSATPLVQEYPDATVDLINNTNNGSWTYLWEYGDQNTATVRNPGSHTYATWGMYNIELTASSPFCESTTNQMIEIESPTPIADFGDSAVGCEPLEVSFINKSLYGASYEWDFGDSTPVVTAENPTHIYFNEGVYSVSLKVTGFSPGAKTDEITKTNYIVVNKTPNANFIMNTTKVFIPNDPVVFSNRSTDADSYTWDFGDGNTSTEQSPVHQYKIEGEFSILLIAETDEGCIDSARSPTNVIAELEGRVRVPNAFTPNPNGSNGGVVNINPGAGEFNDVFYAKVNGTEKYELNIFNKWGELLFVSKDINIGWDGYYKGELAQQDVYVWKISVQFIDGTSLVKVGDLMLLR